MSFFYVCFKKGLKFSWIFPALLSCISCQSLNQVKKAPKKNFYSERIDQSYFDSQADSAYLQGEEAFYKGHNTKALTYFKKALAFAPSSLHLHQRLAEIYEQENLLSEALHHYKILSKKTGQNESWHKKLADIYIKNGLNKQALKHQKYLSTQSPESFSLKLKEALWSGHQGDWNKSLTNLKKAEMKAVSTEEKVQAVLYQAYILAKFKSPAESLKKVRQLAERPINDPELILKIAGFYDFLGEKQTALSYLEDFQKSHGGAKAVSQKLLDHYISYENWDKAVQQLEELKDLGELEESHYFYMALLLMEKQDYHQALKFLKDLNSKSPKNGQYLYLLAMAYEEQRDWKQALKTYNQIQSSSPHFLTARLQSAHMLKQMGFKRKSFSMLKKLAFPSKKTISPQALLQYAESLWKSGQKKKALSILSRGLKKRPSHTDILFLRGFYLKESGQGELALKDMNRILEKEENHEEALNFIASFYSEQNIHLDTAEKLARKALSSMPHSSYFLSTLGWILFQKGDFQPALQHMSKAFEQDKNSVHIAKRLGTIHLQLKNFEKSDYFFKEALRLKNEKTAQPKYKILFSRQALAQ